MSFSLQDAVAEFVFPPVGASTKYSVWNELKRRLRIMGTDPSEVSQQLLEIAVESDNQVLEHKQFLNALKIHGILILVLALGSRFYLQGSLEEAENNLLLDVFLCIGSLCLSGVLVRAFFRKSPKSWAICVTGQGPSAAFTNWLSVFLVDQCAEVGPSPEFISWWKNSLRAERLDGIDRVAERRSYAISWARRVLIGQKQEYKKFLLLVPVTELLLTVILGIGFCGVPVIEYFSAAVSV